jgi:hypothetical protein
MKYRILKNGDVIKKGDQILWDDVRDEWRTMTSPDNIGTRVKFKTASVFRRPLPSKPKPRKVRRPEWWMLLPKNCKACGFYTFCTLHNCENADAEKQCREIWHKLANRVLRRLSRYFARRKP